ncbi:DUF2157 domain-containing protein [Planococcus salinus]|uniref:DUF2157 domain-containing protein n=1 Tax=Planococcus salinus TaxID=1848460 RepID=A0A3M8P317_9BACL|nr:DUF2157 domain-containing protein [Planococcus salinus]RNF38128.1 DUF2157 domain-containing protein [Planococcus salinus]
METERKLAQWLDEGLLDQAAYDRILAFEKRQPQKKKMPLLLLIGLIFFALAVFSFIAANWQAIPDLLKVALVVLLMWFFYILAYFSGKKQFGKPLVFRLLGLAMFAASILVTAQTFHLSTSNSVLPWAIFLAALAHYFLWRRTAYALVAFIFGISTLTSFLPQTGWLEWGIFVAVALSWFYFSKDDAPMIFSWLLLFFSGLLLWDLIEYDSPFWPVWTLFVLVLLLFFTPVDKQRLLAPFYLIFGAVMLVVYLAVRGETELSLVDLNWTESIALAAAGLAVLLLTYFKFRDITWIAILGATGFLLFDDTAIALAVVAELSALAYLIIAQKQDKPLAFGFVYFIAVQFVIYVIYAWERLDMSLFFLIGALLLFALSGIAWWLNRKKEGAMS